MKIFKKSIFFSLTLLVAISVSNIFAAQKRKLSYQEKTRRFLQRYIKPVVGGLAASVLIIITLFCFDQKKKLEEAEKVRLAQAEAVRKAEVERLEAAAQAKIKVAEAQAKTRIEEARVESQAAIKVAPVPAAPAPAVIPVKPVPIIPPAVVSVAIPEEKAHPAPGVLPVAHPAPEPVKLVPVETREEDEAFYQELLNLLDSQHQPFLRKELLKSNGSHQCTFSPSQNMFSLVDARGITTDQNTCSIFAIANAIVDIEAGPDRIKEVQRLATTIFNYIPEDRIGRMVDITDTIKYVPENLKLDMNSKNIVFFTDAELNRHNMPATYEEYMRDLITNISSEEAQNRLRAELVSFFPGELPQVFIASVLAEPNNTDGHLRSLREHSIVIPKTLASEAKSTSPWTLKDLEYAGSIGQDPSSGSECLNIDISDIFKKKEKLEKIKRDGNGKFIIYVNGDHFICVNYDAKRAGEDKFILRDSYNPSIKNVGSYGNLLQNLKQLLGCE